MSRVLFPSLFDLFMAPPLQVEEGFLDDERRSKIQDVLQTDIPDVTVPVALRWRLHPDLGMSREPFQVWRRPRTSLPGAQNLDVPRTRVNGRKVIEWGRKPMFELTLRVEPDVGRRLTILALDDQGREMVGEHVTANNIGIVHLRAANICAVRVRGAGDVLNFNGISMFDMANDPDWELIEIVGLPVEENERPPDIYESGLQGLVSNPVPGILAALQRLQVGEILYEPPPATGPGGIPAPLWPPPDPNVLVFDELRGGIEGPVALVLKMLETVNPLAIFETQSAYEKQMELTGMRQPGGTTATDPANVLLPVAALMLLSAAGDTWSALGLGFGTTDFPPFEIFQDKPLQPDGPSMADFDYMVTFQVTLPFDLKLELAALASVARFLPQRPSEFRARTLFRNRPMDRDDPPSYEVELLWRRLPRYFPPLGYALAMAAGGGGAEVLNNKRPAGGFTPYIPAKDPDGDQEHEDFINFIDNLRTAPLSGSRSDIYLGTALDVFGRWSAWEDAPYNSLAQPPAKPQVLQAQFDLDPDAAVSRVVPAELAVEVVWDWEDRSPHQIDLVGQFYTGRPAPATAPGGLQTAPGGGFGPVVTLEFSGTNINQTPSVVSGTATVTRLPVQTDDGDGRRYKVVITNYSADFSAASRLSYAVYARASEQVNLSGTLFSDFTDPVSANIRDPLPAAPPPLAGPPINWTALPDATGIARYRLTFSTVPHAAGYVVYEATEAAIRQAAGRGPISDPSLTTRATELFGVATNAVVRDTFARVNRVLLSQPQIDLELPGATGGLFVYRVSSVTGQQVESGLSDPLLVAVPRRITPGTPSLRLRPNGGTVHVLVEQGIGDRPAHVELFRTRSRLLMTDVDIMGPPVADGTAGWLVQTDPQTGRQTFEIDDVVAPSWLPYYYRAVAYGPLDTDAGLFPGRSGPSATIEALVPPLGPPDLQPLEATYIDATMAWVRFRSLAEIRPSPLGVHRLSVLTINRQSSRPEMTTHGRQDLPAVPERTGSGVSPAIGAFTRGDIDGDSRWLYETYVPVDDDEIAVRIVDPMGRTSEQRIDMPEPPPAPPDLVDLAAEVEIRFPFTAVLRVTFRSGAPVVRPAAGEYAVEVIGVRGFARRVLAAAALHEIGTTPADGVIFRSKVADGDGRFRYGFGLDLRGPFRTITEVIVRLTDPAGASSELRSNVR